MANDYRTTYTWDYRNRLTDVEYFNNSGVLTKHVHYVYDTLDHEIGKQVDDTGGGSYDRSEWYVLGVSPAAPQADKPTGSLADPLLQFDQNGNLQFRYFNGPSPAGDDAVYVEEQIGTQGQAGTEYFPLGDNENTPHETVNSASTVVDHMIGNTFGVVTSESNPSIHHWSGFEGGHLDVDTAAVDDYFRWYDPPTARWLTEDPKGFGAHDPNLSRYSGNSPADNRDPIGLDFLSNYWYYLWNPQDMDPGLQQGQAFALGMAAGAVGTGAVILAAPVVASGLMAAGVSSTTATATVSGGLFITGMAGAVNTGVNTYQAWNAGNWNQMWFNVGSLTGGAIVGSFGGGQYMVKGLTGQASPAPNTWNFFALMKYEVQNAYNPYLGPPWSLQYWATAPTPTSGGTAAIATSSGFLAWLYAKWWNMMYG